MTTLDKAGDVADISRAMGGYWMDRDRAERVVKSYQDAFNAAYLKKSVDAVRPGFAEGASVTLNGVPFADLDAFYASMTESFDIITTFDLTKTLRGIDGDQLTVTYECDIELADGATKRSFGIEVWDIDDNDQLTEWTHYRHRASPVD